MVVSPKDYFNKENVFGDYLNTPEAKTLNEIMHIEDWSDVSKLLTYMAIGGLAIVLLAFLTRVFWYIGWVYLFISILVIGYIFTEPTESYNFTLVLGVLFILSFFFTLFGQACLSMLDFTLESTDVTQFKEDPISSIGAPVQTMLGGDITQLAQNLITTLNVAVTGIFVAYGAAAAAEAATLDFGKAARMGAKLTLAGIVVGFIYSIWNMLSAARVPNPIETVVQIGDNVFNKISDVAGLSMMSMPRGSLHMVANSFVMYLPVFLPCILLGVAYVYRNKDVRSLMFAKRIAKDHRITVKRSRFSLTGVVIVLASVVYTLGFFLFSADTGLTRDPIVTLAFYISMIAASFLIILDITILNREATILEHVLKFAKFSAFGIGALYLWFQIFQPLMMDLGLMNETNGLIVMGQGGILGSNILQQFFLVAAPETIVFQVAFIGVGNRLYYYFTKTRLREKREEDLKEKAAKLLVRINAIDIDDDSIRGSNLRKAVRLTALRQKYDKIEQKLESEKVDKLPKSYFIIPTVISAAIGSFFFSTYHCFRRGIGFIMWWRLPTFGLTYFGAGFLLCFIAFFSWPAAIFVHAFNNVLALIMAGGGL